MPSPGLLTITKVIRIVRKDGVQLGFTNFDRNLVIGDLTYYANSAMSPEATKRTIDLGTDSLNLKTILNNELLQEKDIIGGKYNEAKIICAKVNYRELPLTIEQSPEILFAGIVGEIRTTDITTVFEVRSLSSYLNQGVSVQASPLCRWKFGGAECFAPGANTNDISLLSFIGNVSAVTSLAQFNLNFAPSVSLKNGVITFTSGNNQGISTLIKTHNANSNQITLLRSLPLPLTIGDTCEGRAGCAKTVTACKAYGNFINFGGFPYPTNKSSGWMPGTDLIISSPIE